MAGIGVIDGGEGHRLIGAASVVGLANRFLAHLTVRGFSAATVRGYAYDLANFGNFLVERRLSLVEVVPTDLFDYLDWQQSARAAAAGTVVPLAARRPAPATINRRVAAVHGLFEYAVITGSRPDNPVPSARRSSGLRAPRRGLLGHLTPRGERGGGRLV